MVDNVHWNIQWNVPMIKNTQEYSTFSDGKKCDGNSEIDCERRGIVTKYSFKSFITKENLTYNLETGYINNEKSQTLPCKYADRVCNSVGEDQKACAWEPKETRTLARINRAKAKMIKWKAKKNDIP